MAASCTVRQSDMDVSGLSDLVNDSTTNDHIGTYGSFARYGFGGSCGYSGSFLPPPCELGSATDRFLQSREPEPGPFQFGGRGAGDDRLLPGSGGASYVGGNRIGPDLRWPSVSRHT
mmetsp:Transcript_61141/g.162442  ORF Transcript_61141/g.162442 Transcript_61141/m.162442 type:complete len:117 (+) Transcript_61141:81-431(+)